MSKLKVASARRQLGTALSLYLQDLDPVSVHCLAGGGCELIEYYAKKAGAQPFASHILKTFPDMKISEVRRLQRQYWSAFKHATHQHSGEERDDHELLKRFTDSQNDHVLFIGWYDYAAAANAMPIEAQVHQIWYLALYPEKLAAEHSPDLLDSTFPNLRKQSRQDQKRMLNEVIARARTDSAVMNDPATDTRGLILGW
jgi:hypothetical protein